MVISDNTLVDSVLLLGTDSVVDFEATRFRVYASKFHLDLRAEINVLSDLAKSPLSTIDKVDFDSGTDLKLVFDITELSQRRVKGFLKSSWIPFSIFFRGERVFAIHAIYDKKGARISGISLIDEKGKETRTPCRRVESAIRICKSYILSYLLIPGNTDE